MNYSAFNSGVPRFLDNKRLRDLQPADYNVTAIRAVNTQKWGEKVVAEIDNQFVIWLPQKVARIILEDDQKWLKTMQSDVEKNNLILRYIGGPGYLMEFHEKDE